MFARTKGFAQKGRALQHTGRLSSGLSRVGLSVCQSVCLHVCILFIKHFAFIGLVGGSNMNDKCPNLDFCFCCCCCCCFAVVAIVFAIVVVAVVNDVAAIPAAVVAPISVVVCVYILNDVPAIAVAAPTVATIVFATVVVAYVVNDVAAVAAVMTIFIPLLFPISGLLLTLLRLLLSR